LGEEKEGSAQPPLGAGPQNPRSEQKEGESLFVRRWGGGLVLFRLFAFSGLREEIQIT
jgi:hypothetical protein